LTEPPAGCSFGSCPQKPQPTAAGFSKELSRACPLKIRRILTDNGKEFTDRLFALRRREPTGRHEFDKLCAELDIEHRLTKPRSLQIQGRVERFNDRIADVLKTNHFVSGEDLEQTIMRYVALYNTQFPQSALGSRTNLQAMKDWHKSNLDLFVKKTSNPPGCDN
jgi:transposase InsO family protein